MLLKEILTQLQAHALAEPMEIDVLAEPPFYVQIEELIYNN